MDLKCIKGIGPKVILILNNLGIYNINDLIRYYPHRFDCLVRRNINDIKYYDNMCVDGIVEKEPVLSFFGKKNRMSFSMLVQNKIIKVIIFNRGFMKNNIKAGMKITIIGKYNDKNMVLTASNILLHGLDSNMIINPIYHVSSGITSSKLNSFINEALKNTNIKKSIPDRLISKYNFIDEVKALNIIHNPKDEKSLKEALKTLKYEELYDYLYKIKLLKLKNMEHDNIYIKNINDNKVDLFVKSLPFDLTEDQKKVLDEMLVDIKSDIKMNRLLQGDVGSGKTIISFILAYACKTAGYQSALMAPTEVLAIQHYENAINIFNKTDFKIGLLTGKMSLKEKKEVYKKLENNEIDFLIGTHALISDNVSWNNLGLVITDEQHRFGVNQRLKLKNKGVNPDILMMSATPIPRTYALTIYGDTDISSIRTMPKGRKKVITYVKKKSELKSVLENIYSALKNNNQVYVIAPMIEDENTDYTNVYDLKHKFELAFKNYRIEILHGKMDSIEKSKIMDEYLNNKINILISTTVIEVGVDVKNATVIVIFDANLFGLSTLHQLRGRVGRNNIQSYCYLISDKDVKRLKIMEETNDGYKISEEDFKLRGQGDVFGSKQSGIIPFKLSDVKKDYDLILKVKGDVDTILK